MLHKSTLLVNKSKAVALLGTMILCLAPLASCDTLSSSTKTSINKNVANFYLWLNAPWTDDDSTYQSLRSDIDISLTKADHPAQKAEKYEEQYKKTPTNAKALFGYCYSAYKASELPNGINKSQFDAKFDDLYTLIAKSKLPLPHTYNYARLVFLGASRYHSAGPKLISVGTRLFKHKPSDDEVEYALSTMLTFSSIKKERDQAILYQHDLASRFPSDPRTYRLLGIIYYRMAWLSHSQLEADKSIAAYEREYELSRQDTETQREGKTIVNFIQHLKLQWK